MRAFRRAMVAFAWILLLAATTRVQLVDEVYTIPANEWRYVELGLNQKPALVIARFDAGEPSKQVQMALMRRADLERLRAGVPHGVMAETGANRIGALTYQVPAQGEYVVVVDNRSPAAASVHLTITLDFGRGHLGPEVTRLSPERQLTVIVISFAVFFGIVTWSARRLLRGIHR